MVGVTLEDGPDFEGEVYGWMQDDGVMMLGIKTTEFSKTADGPRCGAVVWLPFKTIRLIVVTAPAGE